MPFKGTTLNYIEVVNDCFLLWTGTVMIIFSDFVLDVKVRYEFGFIYMYSIILIIIVNFILIIVESIATYKNNKRSKSKKRMLELLELQNTFQK